MVFKGDVWVVAVAILASERERGKISASKSESISQPIAGAFYQAIVSETRAAGIQAEMQCTTLTANFPANVD